MRNSDLLKTMEEKTLERKIIFSGNIIEVVEDTVSLPKGGTGQRELVFHPGGVGIVAITPENKVLLVRQFRKPLEEVLLEIPAGKREVKDHADEIETALRELEEETGYTTPKLVKVCETYLSPGFSNEKLWVYFTDELIKVENPMPQDEDEILELTAYTLEEAMAAVENGEIKDAKTIIGLQYWQLHQEKGK